jgi:hypothetical protein
MKSILSLLSAFTLCAAAFLFVQCTKQQIVITSPAAGAKLLAGDTVSVQWTPSVANPGISYNYNLTSSAWQQFTTVLPAGSQEAKVVIPDTWSSDSFQIKVEDNDGKRETGISGYMATKYIIITNPVAGRTYSENQSVNITFRALASKFSSLRVMLKTDSKMSFTDMLAGSVPLSTQSIPWVIGAEPAGSFIYPSNYCAVKLRDYNDAALSDSIEPFIVH